ncbi:MAG: CoB--CoM heterodisulfide reductase iron-sulfur subunit A family protein [Crenarchaeota archaeon]|nr:CoB--CoM heterodisulfide reductase iron-sulfur subunit A family protein [Thermoproteota archaeon]MCR8501727.1 CoB--CoM heterodisulfide reductase iron-sulfur subunit A family protein [Thermoproteota archaeon]
MERIGVFVCHCGRNIAGTVNVKEVVDKIRKHPLVVHAEEYKYMCSSVGQNIIREAIKKHGLTGIVVAACSPSMHLETFRTAAVSAGLNPYKVEMANIREQNSWVHDDVNEATRKALGIMWSAVNKVAGDQPLEKVRSSVKKKCLVIGGGIAGIQAALDVANNGFEVILVEKSPTIGGRMAQLSETFPTLDCAQCILTPKMAEVARNPNIKIYTLSEVIEVSGSIGNFKVKIRKNPRYVDIGACNMCGECEKVCPQIVLDKDYNRSLTVRKAIYIPFPQAIPAAYVIDASHCHGVGTARCNECAKVCEQKAINLFDKEEIIEEEVGAIIVATGYDLYPKEKIGEYGYGRLEDVIDSLQFERLISSTGPTGGELRRPSDGKIPKRIAFIQCVGSRDLQHLPYCSRICCMYTAKHAFLYKHLVPDGEAYVFYIDIRAAGKRYEEFIMRVQQEGRVKYIRGRVSKIVQKGDQLIVHAVDTITGKPMTLPFDMVVLATGIVPNTKEIANVLRIPLDENGFLQELHPKLAPVESPIKGIFLAGVAQGPKDIQDSVAQASAAAKKAVEILSKDYIEREPLIARVNKELCSRCGVCVQLCPYHAIEMTPEGAKIIDAACEGCGTCAAACPSGAIILTNNEPKQIISMIDALLVQAPSVLPTASSSTNKE